MTEEEKKTVTTDPVESFLFPEQQAKEQEEMIDKNRVTFNFECSWFGEDYSGAC